MAQRECLLNANDFRICSIESHSFNSTHLVRHVALAARFAAQLCCNIRYYVSQASESRFIEAQTFLLNQVNFRSRLVVCNITRYRLQVCLLMILIRVVN
jgi:hypothetical protein